MTAEEQIIQILEKQFTQMKNMSINYHNNPYSPVNVHQYRVHMRRLRSLLNFLKPILDEDSYKEINSLLREQGQTLSPIRDIDVFIENMNETAISNPDLLDNYADLFKFLHEERLRIIHDHASEEDIEASKKTMKQVEEKLTQLSFNLEDGSYDDFVEKRFDKNKSKLEKEYKKISDSDYEQIHEIRKLAKKVRYTADGYKEMLPKKKTKKVVKQTKKIQEELGAVTDAHVQAEILEKHLEEVEDEKLKEAFETLLSYQSSQSE